MKYFLLIFLLGCQDISGQNENNSAKEDAEFIKLLNKVEANNQASKEVQQKASESQSKIVKETVTKIVTLKEENKDLKIELNEVKVKLDSISVDMGVPFRLLPISPKKNF
jgi:seryl-tRNA synthetase